MLQLLYNGKCYEERGIREFREGKCLLCKYEDVSLVFRYYIKKKIKGVVFVVLVLRRWGWGLQGLLVSQFG